MKLYIVLFLFILSVSAQARKTYVATASDINNVSWLMGDTLIMKNGVWTDQSISFFAQGTDKQPVVLMAETPGQVILNGSSKLSFAGKYVEINGLYFKNGNLSGSDVVSFRTSSSAVAENCKLTNTTIENYNPPLNTVDSKWVSLYGLNNKVDHCSFVNKNNSGTLMVVWLTSGVTASHIISDNYFGSRNSNLDSNGDELNGQEIIRVGDSNTSMTTASVTVEGNFFEKCNGEIEVVSNKSCGNLYKNNLFLECKGMLTLRHGNNCTVNGNYFFGNAVSESGGVRIIGEGHKVFNNYFEKLKGTNYRSAICIVRGKENSALNEYFQVKNALVAFNTMVDCSQSFSVNYNSNASFLMPPIGSTIANNHIYNSSSSNTNVNISSVNVASMDVNWDNNLMNQGKYTNFSYTGSQVITGKDAKMILAGTPINMYEPGTSSALLNYTKSDYPDIINDIRGRDRDAAKIPGASQTTGVVSAQMPLKMAVGAAFYNNPTAGVNSIEASNLFKIVVQHHNVIINSDAKARLFIYDTLARELQNQLIDSGSTTLILNKSGIYIFQLLTTDGQMQSEKIIIN